MSPTRLPGTIFSDALPISPLEHPFCWPPLRMENVAVFISPVATVTICVAVW